MTKLQETMSFLIDYANHELDDRDLDEDQVVEELNTQN